MCRAVAYRDGDMPSVCGVLRKVRGGVRMSRINTLLLALAAIGFAVILGGAPYGP